MLQLSMQGAISRPRCLRAQEGEVLRKTRGGDRDSDLSTKTAIELAKLDLIKDIEPRESPTQAEVIDQWPIRDR